MFGSMVAPKAMLIMQQLAFQIADANNAETDLIYCTCLKLPPGLKQKLRETFINPYRKTIIMPS
jgi:hypothetical protein